jgi:hypothetical protein
MKRQPLDARAHAGDGAGAAREAGAGNATPAPKRFRVYIEETSTRLLSRVVEATSEAEAEAIAHAALDDDTWADWQESSSDASLEVNENLTERVDAHGSPLKAGEDRS